MDDTRESLPEAARIQDALDRFHTLFETLDRANRQLATELTQQREDARALLGNAERDLLLELLELHDRLHSLHAQAMAWDPGVLGRASGAGDFVAGMAGGLATTLRHLDESLRRREVQPVRALGQPFDPRTMRALELIRDPWQKPGIVVREVRAGYLRGDAVLRLADVIVTRSGEDLPPP